MEKGLPAHQLLFGDKQQRIIHVHISFHDALQARGAPLVVATQPHDLAYLMYTSGSTGEPKGVQIEHRSIVRLCKQPNFMPLSPATVMLQAAPLGFDAGDPRLRKGGGDGRDVLVAILRMLGCREGLHNGADGGHGTERTHMQQGRGLAAVGHVGPQRAVAAEKHHPLGGVTKRDEPITGRVRAREE